MYDNTVCATADETFKCKCIQIQMHTAGRGWLNCQLPASCAMRARQNFHSNMYPTAKRQRGIQHTATLLSVAHENTWGRGDERAALESRLMGGPLSDPQSCRARARERRICFGGARPKRHDDSESQNSVMLLLRRPLNVVGRQPPHLRTTRGQPRSHPCVSSHASALR